MCPGTSCQAHARADGMTMSARHTWADWVMLLSLTLIWGSSFLLTKVAVSGLAPDLVVAGRLLVAVLVLLPLAFVFASRPQAGLRLWIFYVFIALLGNLLPFSLIAWGQTGIDSGLAGILMAVMPLATLALAHFFIAGEQMTRMRAAGFFLGFAGVLVLMGPEALDDLANGEGRLMHMLAVLGGALSYGVSSILARLRPRSDALFSAAATVSIATSMMLGVLWVTQGTEMAGMSAPLSPPSLSHWIAVVLLGVLSTGLATIIYFRLVESAGPSFVSQLNYLIPLWAVFIGVLFLGEEPALNHLYALAIILAGILVTQVGVRHR